MIRPIFLALLAAPALAEASPTLTYTACQSSADRAALGATLRSDGWQVVGERDREAFVEAMTDGLTIALNNAAAADLDWAAARSQAADLSNTMIRAAGLGVLITLYRAEGAALSVLEADENGAAYIHCLYAGPADDAVREMLETMGPMDAAAGIRSKNEEYGTYTVRTTKPGGPIEVTDMQVSIYADPGAVVAGEAPSVEMGFSSYTFPAR